MGYPYSNQRIKIPPKADTVLFYIITQNTMTDETTVDATNEEVVVETPEVVVETPEVAPEATEENDEEVKEATDETVAPETTEEIAE